MGLKFEGNKSVFSGIEKQFESLLEEEIFDTTEAIADGARSRVPVDTGLLKGSIITRHEKFEGEVIAAQHYAPYVEFGTGGFVDVPAGLETYASRFKGKGIKQVNLPPRPFLYPTWKQETNEMMNRLERAINGKNGAKSVA